MPFRWPLGLTINSVFVLNVEDQLAEGGIEVSRESIRTWFWSMARPSGFEPLASASGGLSSGKSRRVHP